MEHLAIGKEVKAPLKNGKKETRVKVSLVTNGSSKPLAVFAKVNDTWIYRKGHGHSKKAIIDKMRTLGFQGAIQ